MYLQLTVIHAVSTLVARRAGSVYGLQKNGGTSISASFGTFLYISIFTILGLRIDEIVALLLYYCLSSLYRLTHPGQREIQAPCYLSHTNTKISYCPIAPTDFLP